MLKHILAHPDEYSPPVTLVGRREHMDYGFDFKILADSRIDPFMGSLDAYIKMMKI